MEVPVPTGTPWIDSNGWQARLARLQEPGKPVWVTTEFPKQKRVFTTLAYLPAVIDASMYGARWVIDLDADLRGALAGGEARAMETWRRLMDAARAVRSRSEDRALGEVGILSDFAGGHEFASGELLNLTAPLHQPYQILEKSELPPLGRLKAIVYADAEPCEPEVRRKLLEFVQAGGLLIAGEKCGVTEGTPASETHRNYIIRKLGQGRVAIGDLSDPYQTAADAQILLSHRHDVVRCWNGSALGSYLTQGRGGKGATLQVVNYAGRPGADPVSVRAAGPYRDAKIQRLEDAAAQPLEATQQKGAIEMHLPPVSVYAAIEFGVTMKSATMISTYTRRQWLAGAAAFCAARPILGARPAPTAPVAVAKCPDYGPDLLPTMQKMFDQLGGLGAIVKNKTVSIKVNLTGSPTYRLGYAALEDTHYTHPRVIAAAVHLMGRAGARRIRILESPWSTADSIEEYILQANWEPRDILNAAANVEFENTNWLGRGKKYSRFPTPQGGHIFKGFDLNHSYEDCDVFVSIAKMKDHVTAGVTLSMKNCFGITPCTIYGQGAGVDEPSVEPRGGRGMFHAGDRQPSKCSPAENDPTTPREGGYRVPRIVADLVAARPIHLAIIEGIKTMAGGEGPWTGPGLRTVSPGVLVAGTNCVSTDAVAMSVMDYDPMADRGTPPFEKCDSTLRLAEELGVGTRDLKRIEVVGTPVAQARFSFAEIRRQRKA